MSRYLLLIPIFLVLGVFLMASGGEAIYTSYDGPAPLIHYTLDEEDSDIPAPGPNLLSNPGFETYTTSPGTPDNWLGYAVSNDLRLSKEISDINSGSNALKLTGDGAINRFGVNQIFAPPNPGDSYRFAAYTHSQSGAVPALGPRVSISDGVTLSGRTTHRDPNDLTYTVTPVAFKTVGSDGTYSFELTMSEVLAADTNGKVIFFDDATVTKTLTVSDSIGTNHGALAYGENGAANMVGYNAPNNLGYHFDGVAEVIDIDGRFTSFDTISAANELTITGWFNGETFNHAFFNPLENLAKPRIIERINEYRLGIDASDSTPNLEARINALTPNTITGNTLILPGQWYFAAVTWDSDTSQLCLYLNANLEKCQTATGTLPTSDQQVTIAAMSTFSEFWHGKLDDIQIFSEGLTSDQIYKLYHQTVSLGVIAPNYSQYGLALVPLVIGVGLTVYVIGKKDGE